MATPEEIRQRIEQADTARSARRAAAAQQVGELAQRRAGIVAQLTDVERELGKLVADAQDVIGVDELAAFTDLKPSDLTAWLAGYKPSRGRRRKPTTTAAVHDDLPTSSGVRASSRSSDDNSVSGSPNISEPCVARAS